MRKNKKYWYKYEYETCSECGRFHLISKTRQYTSKPKKIEQRHIYEGYWCDDCRIFDKI